MKDKGIKFETLKKPKLIRNLVILFMITFIGSAIYFKTSSAKYQTTQVIPIINTKVVNKPWWTLTIKETGKEDKVLKSGPGITDNNYIFDYQLEDGYGISSFTCIRRDKTPVLDTEITITIENKKLKITDSAKKRGTVCEVNMLDTEPPTAPTMNYNNGTITLGGSHDNLTTDKLIKYKYSINCTDAYTDGNTIDVTQLNQNTYNICAIAEDEAGNQSNLTRKKLGIIASATKVAENKYYCSETDSYVDEQSKCKKAKDTTKTQTNSYVCSGYKAENKEFTTSYPTVSSCNISSSFSCDANHNQKSYVTSCTENYTYNFVTESTQSGLDNCSAVINTCDSTKVGQKSITCTSTPQYYCPRGFHPLNNFCLSDSVIGIGNAEAEVKCPAFCQSYGLLPGGARRLFVETNEWACNCQATTILKYTYTMTTNTCTAIINNYTATTQTCQYTAAVNGKYQTPTTTTTDECKTNGGTQCSITPSNCPVTGGSCSISGSKTCSNSCSGACYYNGTEKFYCSLNGKYYSSKAEATAACSNYCSAGTYYNTKCYNLTD